MCLRAVAFSFFWPGDSKKSVSSLGMSSCTCSRGSCAISIRTLRLLRILTDQRRTRMGAGILRRNGDAGNYGIHVYDTRLTADTMTLTPNVTTRDTTNGRRRTVTTTVVKRDTNVTYRMTYDGYSRHGLDESRRLVFQINYD